MWFPLAESRPAQSLLHRGCSTQVAVLSRRASARMGPAKRLVSGKQVRRAFFSCGMSAPAPWAARRRTIPACPEAAASISGVRPFCAWVGGGSGSDGRAPRCCGVSDGAVTGSGGEENDRNSTSLQSRDS